MSLTNITLEWLSTKLEIKGLMSPNRMENAARRNNEPAATLPGPVVGLLAVPSPILIVDLSLPGVGDDIPRVVEPEVHGWPGHRR
jgi:hypothetical protein